MLNKHRFLGLQYRRQYPQLDSPSFEADVNGVFDDALLSCYVDALNLTIPEGWTKADLARKFGVDRSTVGRWLDGQCPGLEDFVRVAAANDAEFPRGSMVTLLAYCAAFDAIQQKLGKHNEGLLPEQASWLYHTCRSVEWQEGRDDKARHKLEAAVKILGAAIKECIDEPTIKSVEEVESVLGGRIVAWLILESVLKHEWL